MATAGCAIGTSDVGLSADLDGGSAIDAAAASDGAVGSDGAPRFDAAPPTGDAASLPDATTPDAATHVDASAHDASTHVDAGANDTGTAIDSALPDASTTCTSRGFSGALVTFDLGVQPGNEATAAPMSSATDVTGGALARASALTAVAGSGSINASNWAMGASADPTRYFTFSLTVASGCTLSLTSLAIDVHASGTGPATIDVATSADGFATHGASVSGTGTATVSLAAQGSRSIEVRVYGYGASATAGTLRIQNTMTLSGSIN